MSKNSKKQGKGKESNLEENKLEKEEQLKTRTQPKRVVKQKSSSPGALSEIPKKKNSKIPQSPESLSDISGETGLEAEESQTESEEGTKVHTLFNDAILKLDDYFRDNISKVPPNRWSCKTCKANFASEKRYSGFTENLEKHLRTPSHISFCGLAQKRMEELADLLRDWKRGLVDSNNFIKENEKIIRFEYTIFLFSQGLPYSKVAPLCNFVKYLVQKYPSHEIASTSISNITCSRIAKECIADTLRGRILEEMKKNYYSLALDESQDFFGKSYLAITVSYLESGKRTHILLGMIPIFRSKSADTIYKLFKEKLFSSTEKELLEKNFLGLCTDGAANLMGRKNGLGAKLKRDYPHLVHIHDFSHLFNLIAEKASAKLPDKLIRLIKTISNHFARSGLNNNHFLEIQRTSGKDPKDILEIPTYTEVRFLSLQECTFAILTLWEDLKNYKLEEPKLEVEFNDENKILIMILDFLLLNLTTANEFFQNNQLNYPEINQKLMKIFIRLAKPICKEACSKKEPNLEEEFNHYFSLPWSNSEEIEKHLIEATKIKETYLDWQFIDIPNYFDALSAGAKAEILEATKKFIYTATQELHKSAFQEELLSRSKSLYLKSYNYDEWKYIASRFPNIINLQNKAKFLMEMEDLRLSLSDEIFVAKIAALRGDLSSNSGNLYKRNFQCILKLLLQFSRFLIHQWKWRGYSQSSNP